MNGRNKINPLNNVSAASELLFEIPGGDARWFHNHLLRAYCVPALS